MPLPEPLHEGDRLSGRQFLRRWDAMPDLKRAELIGGVVFMASPLSFGHGTAASAMSAWLWIYKDRTPGCETGIETTWIMSIHDVPQPDAFLRISPDHGGQSHQTAAGYAAGAPELIVEVSGSSLSRDLGVKLDLYRRSGVREYVTVLLNDQRVVWRYLARGSSSRDRARRRWIAAVTRVSGSVAGSGRIVGPGQVDSRCRRTRRRSPRALHVCRAASRGGRDLYYAEWRRRRW